VAFEIYGVKNKKENDEKSKNKSEENGKKPLTAKKDDEKDQIKIMKDISLMEAVKNKDREKIVALIEDGANPTKTYLEYGYYCSAIEIAKKDLPLAELIVDSVIEYCKKNPTEQDLTERQEKIDKTLIIAVSIRADIKQIQDLLDLGANPEATYKNFEIGQSAFIKSAVNNDEVMLRYLIDKVKDVSHCDKDGKTAFMYAMMWRNEKIQNIILDKKLNNNK